MRDATAQTEPLTEGQQIVANYEKDMIAEPCELAASIDVALAMEYERGKRHGSDDRKMIERQNQAQGREIAQLKGEISRLKFQLHQKQQ